MKNGHKWISHGLNPREIQKQALVKRSARVVYARQGHFVQGRNNLMLCLRYSSGDTAIFHLTGDDRDMFFELADAKCSSQLRNKPVELYMGRTSVGSRRFTDECLRGIGLVI